MIPAPPEPRAGVAAPARATAAQAEVALGLLCVAQLMLVLDFSIVNVALPEMQRDLGFTRAGLQWVISAYALTFGGFLMLGGRAADLFGRRRVFVAGMALFTAASLAGGFARAGWTLVAARALQGVGGAIVAPASLSLLTTTFPEGPSRNRAMGWFGTMSTVGFAVGMILGGWLTEEAGWPWVMFINVPIGLGVIALSRWALPEAPPEPGAAGGFDLAGAALITLASGSLVYAMADADRAGWTSGQTLGLLALVIVLVGAFVAVEGRAAHPLVPLGVCRRRDLMGANGVGFCLAASIPAMIYLLTLHMQGHLGYSAGRTGLAFLPHAAVAIVAARVVPRVVDRFGPRAVMAWGAAIFGGSVLLLAGITPAGGYWLELLPGLVITPVGVLFGFIACTILATSGVADREQGLASGLLSTSQQVGQALGLAAVLNVVAAVEARGLARGLGEVGARVAGYRAGFAVEAGFAAVALVLTLTVVRRAARPAAAPNRPVLIH